MNRLSSPSALLWCVQVHLPCWTERAPVWVDLFGTPGRVAWTSSSCLSSSVEPAGPLTHAVGRKIEEGTKGESVQLWNLQFRVYICVSERAHWPFCLYIRGVILYEMSKALYQFLIHSLHRKIHGSGSLCVAFNPSTARWVNGLHLCSAFLVLSTRILSTMAEATIQGGACHNH